MSRTTWLAGCLASLLLLPALAQAQQRGRTDGPEGSEIGKGGYRSPGEGPLSLALTWGASLPGDPGPPLFVGLTGTLWLDEWFVFDVAPAYLANSQRFNLLAGPRFRTFGYPVSGSLGLHAGGIVTPEVGLRFGLSPNIGVEALVDRYLMGLHYALDLPLGGDAAVNHRVFMNVGYRF